MEYILLGNAGQGKTLLGTGHGCESDLIVPSDYIRCKMELTLSSEACASKYLQFTHVPCLLLLSFVVCLP